ncbi:hypothetical protein B0I37DRAFT_408352 [Chaetomium sp. MPI-CAGE-AT-0009]|nr:hypothetical protein B0I37DRAFT_408352 [Chaetomium sp. MPI-CAGE-AT-0009]
MSYFETITDPATFERRRIAEAKDLSKWKDIPPGNEWSTIELHAARRVEKGQEDAHNQKQIQDLLKSPDQLDPKRTSTEFVHVYGHHLGHLWADLAHHGGFDWNDNESSNGDDPSQPPTDSPGHVSAAYPPSLGTEQATAKIASSFIQHVAWSCPPQHDTYQGAKPDHLVELSQLPRKLVAHTGTGAQIRATADSELISYVFDDGNGKYGRDHAHCPALVATGKPFGDVRNGVPLVTDSALGQLTCEALALRLSLVVLAGGCKGLDENVFVIAAARRYMRFLQFKISDAYVEELVAGDGGRGMTNFVELWATPWFDLKSAAGRGNAVDNLVALIFRQPGDMVRQNHPNQRPACAFALAAPEDRQNSGHPNEPPRNTHGTEGVETSRGRAIQVLCAAPLRLSEPDDQGNQHTPVPDALAQQGAAQEPILGGFDACDFVARAPVEIEINLAGSSDKIRLQKGVYTAVDRFAAVLSTGNGSGRHRNATFTTKMKATPKKSELSVSPEQRMNQ